MKSNENEFKKIFANNLKRLMEEKQINNVELSKALDISESAVGKWLLEKSIPRMGMIELLASYFKVNKTDLIEEKTKQKENSYKFKILARNFEKLDPKKQDAIFNIIATMIEEPDDNDYEE